VVEFGEIEPRGEGIARAGDDHHADRLRLLPLAHAFEDFKPHFDGYGVSPLGTVEGENRNAPANSTACTVFKSIGVAPLIRSFRWFVHSVCFVYLVYLVCLVCSVYSVLRRPIPYSSSPLAERIEVRGLFVHFVIARSEATKQSAGSQQDSGFGYRSRVKGSRLNTIQQSGFIPSTLYPVFTCH